MPQSRLLVLELLLALLHLVLSRLTYQLRVIPQLTPQHLFVHSKFDSKSLKDHLLHVFVRQCSGEFMTECRPVKKQEEIFSDSL